MWVKVASLEEIKKGQGNIFDVGGKQIALFNIRGRIFAILNECPHRGGPLGDGELKDNIITCPWHGWSFDIETGKSTGMPVQVKTYMVNIEGNDIFLEI